MADNNTPLLKVEHLTKEFPTGSGFLGGRFSKKVVSAVNDVSYARGAHGSRSRAARRRWPQSRAH